jgi:hypothetical protein
MSRLKRLYVGITVALGFALVGFVWTGQGVKAAGPRGGDAEQDSARALEGLRITLVPERSVYELGELVTLRIRLENTSSVPLPLRRPFTVEHGELQIRISKGDGAFKQHFGAWGPRSVIRGRPEMLLPGASVERTATLLWNYERPLPVTAPEDYARRHENEHVTTPCVFWTTGSYRVVVTVPLQGSSEVISSNAAKITIRAPRGANRALWQVMSESPSEVAYFLQSGAMGPWVRAAAASHIVADLDRVAAGAPEDSRLEWVRSRIAGYKATAERIRAFRQGARERRQN